MPELKPCPFCAMAFIVDEYEPGEFKITHPENDDCPLEDYQIWCGESFMAKHNTRPIEDALRREVEELRGVVRDALPWVMHIRKLNANSVFCEDAVEECDDLIDRSRAILVKQDAPTAEGEG